MQYANVMVTNEGPIIKSVSEDTMSKFATQ